MTILLSIFLISGCVGDRLDFRHKGSVYKKNSNLLCIDSKPGDSITYYLLSSSKNNYHPPLMFEDNINRKYPDTCLPIALKQNISYNIIIVCQHRPT
ncbi:putative T6SS immunity periplasmic lipoprotein [Rouxiella aceris]|uniref:putative T6SS immunity periplasmic lipoprotein n=1 Tax=Rouxiella aceris TaxID=2703884 RepID=UPI0038B4B01C